MDDGLWIMVADWSENEEQRGTEGRKDGKSERKKERRRKKEREREG